MKNINLYILEAIITKGISDKDLLQPDLRYFLEFSDKNMALEFSKMLDYCFKQYTPTSIQDMKKEVAEIENQIEDEDDLLDVLDDDYGWVLVLFDIVDEEGLYEKIFNKVYNDIKDGGIDDDHIICTVINKIVYYYMKYLISINK